MIRFPTLVLGATVGAAALAFSASASAGVRFGVDVAVPVPAVVAPAVVAPEAVAVAYRPGAPYYYGPHFYAGAPYHRYWGPARAYPRYGWHGAYYGHGWHR